MGPRPYHTVLIAPNHPHKNGKNVTSTTVLCNTGARVSLAPVSITDKLGNYYNPRETISVKGADGASIKVLRTAYVFVHERGKVDNARDTK